MTVQVSKHPLNLKHGFVQGGNLRFGCHERTGVFLLQETRNSYFVLVIKPYVDPGCGIRSGLADAVEGCLTQNGTSKNSLAGLNPAGLDESRDKALFVNHSRKMMLA